ncbi:MAG: heme-binding protein [Gemmatimonadaceae bacterium]|nr:heme-binding protein [Gemmatimonadaceae bacterium]
MTNARLTRRLLAGAALAIAVPVSTAAAQTRTARIVAADGVQRAITAALAEAKRQGWNVSIAVVDNSGDLVGFLRMDNASPGSADISQAKARTAARMKRPTRALDSTLTAGRVAILGLPGVTPVEGGVPISINGEIIGAIGVSGATSAQDAQVAQAGAAAIQP